MVQTNYNQITDNPADAGRRIGIVSADNVFGLTAGGGAQEVVTVVVDTAANDTAYAYTYNAAVVTITSDSSATKIEIALALANQHNAVIDAASFGLAVSDGVDTVTITAREVNSASGAVDGDANLTTTVTTAGSAGTAVPFGIGVQRTSFTAIGLPGLGTAKVMTATPTAVNLAEYNVRVTGDFDNDGIDEVYDASFTADASATAQEIVEGLAPLINLALPANSVIVTENDVILTFTSEVAGKDFDVSTTTTLSAAFVVATTTANARNMFQGVALKTQRVETTTANAAEYAADDTVDVMAQGEVWVLLDSGQAPSAGDSVFVRASASGSEQLGAFRTDADTADGILLPNAYWTHPATTALDGVSTIAGLMVRL